MFPLCSPSASWYQASDSTLLISKKRNQPWLTADTMPFSLFTRQLNIKRAASLLKPASFSHPQGQSLTPKQWQNSPRSSPRIAQDQIRLYFLCRALRDAVYPILRKQLITQCAASWARLGSVEEKFEFRRLCGEEKVSPSKNISFLALLWVYFVHISH